MWMIAQELTQDVFIKALSNTAHLRDRNKAAHWLSRIASNAAIDFLRKRRHWQTVAIDKLLNFADDRDRSPEEIAIATSEYDRAGKHLRLLSDRERTALFLREVEELRTAEVSKQMGCSQATVRSHIANARVKLRHHRRNE
jgi:RNA polymerase sigma-70 factor, ECF subfamily